MEKQFSVVHEKVLSRQHLHMRLQDLFMSLSTPATLFTELLPDEKKESLVFTFDNGIDPDPTFSGMVIGKLYLDDKKNLSLAIWPKLEKKETKHPWRKEILMPKIDDYQFEFFGQKKETTSRAVTTGYAWHKKWENNRLETPSQIRLTVLTDDQTLLKFAYFTPTPEPIITYREGGQKS